MKKNKYVQTFLILVFIIILANMFLGYCLSFNNHYEQITVTDKERVNTIKKSKYLIMGTNENNDVVVYENTDNLIRLKFDSSDLYAGIKVGETYNVRVIGIRIPFLSMYKNILSYEEIE